jgi:hypothetical protein
MIEIPPHGYIAPVRSGARRYSLKAARCELNFLSHFIFLIKEILAVNPKKLL